MKVYQPIEGLLSDNRRTRSRWWWLIVPAAALVAFVIHVLIAGSDIAAERRLREAREARVEEAQREAAALIAAASDEGVSAQAAPDEATGGAPDEGGDGGDPDNASDKGDAEAPAAAAKLPASEKVQPGKKGRVQGELDTGQTLFAALSKRGFTSAQIAPAVNSLATVFNFRRSRPGDDYTAEYDSDGNITALSYQRRVDKAYVARRLPKGTYRAREERVPVQTRTASLGGTVSSSLSRAIKEGGERQKLVSKFVDAFAYDIDFGSDTRPGDTFKVIYEKIYIDDAFVRYGRILAAEYKGKSTDDKPVRVYSTSVKDRRGYFDADGRSLKRMFLRNPVKLSRLTSKFGKRMHPVLKTWKLHNGVDYAAPTGSPINPIADGTVAFAGPKGANGNLVVVEHAGGWVSYYAHLSRFKKGLKKGDRVRQSGVIGYVGSTGRSTGPHLHLGVKRNGAFVDPLSIQSTRGPGLDGRDLTRHKNWVREQNRALQKTVVRPPSSKPDPEPAPPTGGDDMGDYTDPT